MTTWLILDANYLCHRAFHTTGDLRKEDIPTGVIYGVLRDVVDFQDRFQAERVLFCFDAAWGHRERLMPSYKATRHKNRADLPPEEAAKRDELYSQINRLRREYLPELGYRNIYHQDGYEGDDLIAELLENNIPAGDQAIIVSSDKDLYQLLDYRTVIYSPHTHKTTTLKSFEEQWRFSPSAWPRLKAIAGCTSDEIAGVEGVGEATAARYIRNELPERYTAYKNIELHRDQWRANLKLTRLPFPGINPLTISPDEGPTAESWAGVADKLGLRSLRNNPPLTARAARRGLGVRCG